MKPRQKESKLKAEVKAVVDKWKGLIDYLKEDRMAHIRTSRVRA